VLLNRDTAEGIANGRITLVLRRWDAPRAKAGGTQRTVAGTIRIDAVTEYPGDYRVTAAQARAAGYPNAKTAQHDLDRRSARHTYAIAVSYLAPDERPDLAADDRLSEADVEAITTRLARWDAATEPWTQQYLEMIAANEAVRAPNLAARVGLDVPRFKRRVRQLKGLGLTISLDVGYRLSPRGRVYLRLNASREQRS
jgi:Tfp pilus assembly protein FimV